MSIANGCGVEPPIWLEHATDLGERLGTVRHVVEHMVGDHRVQRGVIEWDGLCVDPPKVETLAPISKRAMRIVKHPGREV